MCGICGELRWDGQLVSQRLSPMLQAIARRGPDQEQTKMFDNRLALGHRRLSIIDLSDHSHQPFVDQSSGFAIVFNGTIYNYKELREQLIVLGHSFYSQGDTEVILKAYLQWGQDCLQYLEGMFAFVIYDKEKLFLARDRFGIKPLYYSVGEGWFWFASNPQALLKKAEGEKETLTELDPVALHFQFSLHASVPAPYTVFKKIRKLPPAHCMTVQLKGQTKIWPYWHLRPQRPPQPKTQAEWLELTKHELFRSVKSHLLASDVPVGVLLSGGLDSSLIVGVLNALGYENIPTFSIGFEPVQGILSDEFYYSDIIAKKFRTQHHKYVLANREMLNTFSKAVENMAEPMVSTDVTAFYLLAQRVSKEVKVVQSGQGADEVFGGYSWYEKMLLDPSHDPVEKLRRFYLDRSHHQLVKIFSNSFFSSANPSTTDSAISAMDYTGVFLDELLHQPDADDMMDQIFRADVGTFMVDDPVKRVDNMTMAWGLEARVPFLDHKLVELAMQMPAELKLQDQGKWPLKQVARELIPSEVIDRPKGYFPIPALQVLEGEFSDFVRQTLTSQKCRNRGLFAKNYVDELLNQKKVELTPIGGNTLWHMAVLETWLQQQLGS